MKKWMIAIAVLVASIGAFALVSGQKPAEAGVEVVVYKSPSCGCCVKWEEHLQQAGFKVTAHKVDNLNEVKAVNGVPRELSSCHTAVVNGYIVEGHVPASSIRKLLTERPTVKGISVPGMPIGSPGMEGPNPEPYDVITFNEKGETSVFESF